MGNLADQRRDNPDNKTAPYDGNARSKKPTVETPSAAYKAMAPKWDLINTVLAGTVAVRARGTDLLPRHPYESTEAYDERLAAAVFDNFVKRTLDDLVGKAFKEPPTLDEDVPEAIQTLLEDADGQGLAFQPFARSFWRQGAAKAFAHVLVDCTRAEPRADGQPRTLADDQRDGVRPFLRLVMPEDVIFAHTGTVGGVQRYVHVRIRELTVESDGEWGEVVTERIRVLRPGSFELYKKVKTSAKKYEWQLDDSGPMGSFDHVPMVTFYTDRDGLCEGTPALLPQAELNVTHYQSSADQRSILTVGRFPMLAVSGAAAVDDSGKPLPVGPKQFLSVEDAQGEFYYVEPEGTAIEAGRKDLEALEDRLSSYGAQFTRKQPGTATATGKVLDSAEAMSPLQAWAVDFKDCLELCLQYMAVWLGLGADAGGSVVYEVEPEVDLADPTELDAIKQARASRDLSREAYLNELQRRGILDEEFDAAKDKELLDKEPPDVGGPLGGMFGKTAKAADPAQSSKPKPPTAGAKAG